MKSHVLVTGGAGFIGSHVADALLARGHEVTVLDDLSGGFADNVPAAPASSRPAWPTTPPSIASSRKAASITSTTSPRTPPRA